MFFWEISPKCGWVGWLIPNKVQTPQTHAKSPRKWPFLTRISPFVLPNLTKTLLGKQIWERSPKKTYFFTPFLTRNPHLHSTGHIYLRSIRAPPYLVGGLLSDFFDTMHSFLLLTVNHPLTLLLYKIIKAFRKENFLWEGPLFTKVRCSIL